MGVFAPFLGVPKMLPVEFALEARDPKPPPLEPARAPKDGLAFWLCC